MSVVYLPKNCAYKPNEECYYNHCQLDTNYKGKYVNSNCQHCWKNTLKPRRKSKIDSIPKMNIVKNTSKHYCPTCFKRFKEGEYVIDLGSYGKKNFLHINCLDTFIGNLVKFKEDMKPIVAKIIAKSI
jgi:hypothetical protein